MNLPEWNASLAEKPMAPVIHESRPWPQENFSWSFSQWEAYNQCPAKWKFSRTMPQFRRPAGPAAARGIDMHDRCEDYILGKISVQQLRFGNTSQRFGSKKPAIIHEKYVPILEQFKDHPNGDRHTELKLGLDDEWYLSGNINSRAWLVAVLDAARVLDGVAYIGEWKSGQPKDTHADQRKMYALVGLRRWLGVVEVRATTYYLEDTAPPVRLVASQSAEQKLKDLWRGRVEDMRGNTICAPRPGDYCQNMCDWAANKGGPCEFGR